MEDDVPFLQVAARTRTLVELPRGQPVVARATFQDPTGAEHLSWMLSRAAGFCTGKPGRAHLWLGFVQGVLATRGISVDELDVANRDLEIGSYRG